jgi:hypothetical protein
VAPDVDHGTDCTWHWTSVKYPEPVGVCVGSTQLTGRLCYLLVEQGTGRPRWSPGVVEHPWGPMVGIPTPPKRGHGQLSYSGLGCSYFGNREDSYPMCEGAWNFTCAGYV